MVMETVTEVVEVLYINRSHGSDNDYIICKAENLVGRAILDAILHVNCKFRNEKIFQIAFGSNVSNQILTFVAWLTVIA